MKKEELKPLIPALDNLGAKLKALFASDAPIDAPTDEPVKATEVEAQDGTKLKIEGDLAQGSKVTVLSQDGTEVPAPDGDILLKDGTTISIKDELIVEVKAPEAPVLDDQPKEQPFAKEVQSLQTRITELSEKLSAYEKANAILMSRVEKADATILQAKEVIVETFKVVEQIAGLPAEKSIEAKPMQFNKKTDKIAGIAEALKNIKTKNN